MLIPRKKIGDYVLIPTSRITGTSPSATLHLPLHEKVAVAAPFSELPLKIQANLVPVAGRITTSHERLI
jgi:hypothetical protein